MESGNDQDVMDDGTLSDHEADEIIDFVKLNSKEETMHRTVCSAPRWSSRTPRDSDQTGEGTAMDSDQRISVADFVEFISRYTEETGLRKRCEERCRRAIRPLANPPRGRWVLTDYGKKIRGLHRKK